MTTSTEWTITGWSATALARKVAGRGDVTVVIDPDPTAAALDVDPADGTIRIGAEAADLPEAAAGCRLDSLAHRLEQPVLAGLVLDGAARTAHSRWRAAADPGIDQEIVSTAWSLDAARAHRRLIDRNPASRLFLRASTPVMLRGNRIDVREAVEGLLPRVDAGVLPRWAGTRLREAVAVEIGDGALSEFEQVWRQILGLRDAEGSRLLELSAQWVQLWRTLDSAPAGDTETTDTAAAGGIGGDSTDGNGDPPDGADTVCNDEHQEGSGPDGGAADGAGSEGEPPADPGSDTEITNPSSLSTPGASSGTGFSDLVDDILDTAIDEADTAAATERHRAAERAPSPEDRENASQRALATEIANTVFTRSAARRLTHRTPTADDTTRRAAIVRRLQRAQYAAPRVITEHVGYPAGRPRTGALVQRAAQRAQRQAVTATPWRRNRRRVAEKPPIHAGIVVDYSGSMSAWLPSAGTAMWSLAAAVDELGGTAAAAGFGGAVTALMHPHTRPTLVPVVPDGGSSSGCAEAMAAVSNAAALTVPFGARVLLVLTDGQLPGHDAAAIAAHTRYLHRHGVTVVWALTGSIDRADVVPEHAVVVDHVTPDAFATVVADTIVNALEAPHAGL